MSGSQQGAAWRRDVGLGWVWCGAQPCSLTSSPEAQGRAQGWFGLSAAGSPVTPIAWQTQHLPHLLVLVQREVHLVDLPSGDGVGGDQQADTCGMGMLSPFLEPSGPPVPSVPVLGIMSRPPRKLKVP